MFIFESDRNFRINQRSWQTHLGNKRLHFIIPSVATYNEPIVCVFECLKKHILFAKILYRFSIQIAPYSSEANYSKIIFRAL